MVDVGLRFPVQDPEFDSAVAIGVHIHGRVCDILFANSRHVAICKFLI